MSAALLVQTLVIALLVGWSALFAARRLLPASSRRAQAALAERFDRQSAPRWLRALARRLQPKSTIGSSCASGCSSCGGCAATQSQSRAQPLVFQPRRKG